MLTFVFAVFLGLGAFAAIRRNPSYSGGSLLRSLALTLLAIGALVAIIITTVNLTIHKSPLISGIAIAAVVVFGTLAMIFIVRAVTTPKVAKLTSTVPPGVKLVHIHRRKVYMWAKVFAFLIAFFVIVSIAIPGDAKDVVYALGSIPVLLATILLPVMYISAREFDVSLTALRLNPWVHWQYTPEQWLQWSNLRATRITAVPSTFVLKRDWRRFILPFAIITGGVACFSPGSPPEKMSYILGVCGIIFALTLGITAVSRNDPERMRAKLLKAPREVYMGRDGIFADGAFTTWLGVSVYLLDASIDERQPRSLFFRFEKAVPNPYGLNQTIPIQQFVLIPDHSESDIARLQQQLAVRCPGARIQLV